MHHNGMCWLKLIISKMPCSGNSCKGNPCFLFALYIGQQHSAERSLDGRHSHSRHRDCHCHSTCQCKIYSSELITFDLIIWWHMKVLKS